MELNNEELSEICIALAGHLNHLRGMREYWNEKLGEPNVSEPMADLRGKRVITYEERLAVVDELLTKVRKEVP